MKLILLPKCNSSKLGLSSEVRPRSTVPQCFWICWPLQATGSEAVISVQKHTKKYLHINQNSSSLNSTISCVITKLQKLLAANRPEGITKLKEMTFYLRVILACRTVQLHGLPPTCMCGGDSKLSPLVLCTQQDQCGPPLLTGTLLVTHLSPANCCNFLLLWASVTCRKQRTRHTPHTLPTPRQHTAPLVLAACISVLEMTHGCKHRL